MKYPYQLLKRWRDWSARTEDDEQLNQLKDETDAVLLAGGDFAGRPAPAELGADIASGVLRCDEDEIGVFLVHARTPRSPKYGKLFILNLVTPAMQVTFADLSAEDLHQWSVELTKLWGSAQRKRA